MTDQTKFPKPSQVLAFASWGYVFVSGMLLLVRTIPTDGLSWGLFALFIFIAVFASAVAQGKAKGMSGHDVRINIAGQIFTGDALKVHELRDGSVFVYVDLERPLKKEEIIAAPEDLIVRVDGKTSGKDGYLHIGSEAHHRGAKKNK